MIFACENNLYSEFTDSRTMCRNWSRARRGPRPPSRAGRPLARAFSAALRSALVFPCAGASADSDPTIAVAPVPVSALLAG